MTIDELVQVALQHHQAGQLDQAEALYIRALNTNPCHPAALHLAGVLAGQRGEPDTAIHLIQRAILANPLDPIFRSNLAKFLLDQKRPDEALAACREALRLQPDFADAHTNLGLALQQKGAAEEALEAWRRAIALNPHNPEAHNNLASGLRALGRLDDAIAEYEQAIRLHPRYGDAQNNLGLALQQRGRLDESVLAFRRAIVVLPRKADACVNLGNSLFQQARPQEALAAYQHALKHDPHHAAAHAALGHLLLHLGQLDDAEDACRRAVALNPSLPEALNNLGNVLKEQGRLTAAIGWYRAAVALWPNLPALHSNLLYALHFHPDYDAPTLFAEHRLWNQRHAAPFQPLITAHNNDRDPDRRLRIGYVSPDFRDHAVGRFLLPLITAHAPDQVEVVCYSEVALPDALTIRFKTHAHLWHNVAGLTDEQLAQVIRQDRIDILVDLAMHGAGSRMLLFARKPAPVQLTYLAYCSTTGLDAVDYRFTDPFLDPPSPNATPTTAPDRAAPSAIYSERSIHLPETYWCYAPPAAAPDVSPLPAPHAGHVTFGCLNNFAKISPSALALWARLLQAVPDSRLILHAGAGRHCRQVADQFAAAGVASDRLAFVGLLPRAAYFEQYHRIDIALDPFPYAGGTTTCDALWMGAPVVTLAGRTAVGRGGVSILSNLSLPELIAATPDQYLAIAANLACDLPRLQSLRAALRPRLLESPLMNAPQFTRHVEAAFRQMWRAWCS